MARRPFSKPIHAKEEKNDPPSADQRLETAKLNELFLTFIVNNGPVEQPSCPLVQMCIVRFLNFLKLDKVIQVYHCRIPQQCLKYEKFSTAHSIIACC